jgi:hypothetical protein
MWNCFEFCDELNDMFYDKFYCVLEEEQDDYEFVRVVLICCPANCSLLVLQSQHKPVYILPHYSTVIGALASTFSIPATYRTACLV